MAMAFDPNRWTLRTQEAIQAAVEMARTQAHPEVTPDHLVAALVGQQEGVVLPILGKVGVAPLSLRNRAGEALARLPKAHRGQPPQISRDMRAVMEAAEAARAGKLDPVIGRDEEIRRVIQVLSRRTKNNPVLIGEPGVGKTAIVEGL